MKRSRQNVSLPKSEIKKRLVLRRLTRVSDGKRVWVSGLDGREFATLADAEAALRGKKDE